MQALIACFISLLFVQLRLKCCLNFIRECFRLAIYQTKVCCDLWPINLLKKQNKTLYKDLKLFFMVHQFGAFALPVRRGPGTYCGASSLLVLMQDLIYIASAVARSVCQWLDATLFVMVFIFRSSAWWPVNTSSVESTIFLPPVYWEVMKKAWQIFLGLEEARQRIPVCIEILIIDTAMRFGSHVYLGKSLYTAWKHVGLPPSCEQTFPWCS